MLGRVISIVFVLLKRFYSYVKDEIKDNGLTITITDNATDNAMTTESKMQFIPLLSTFEPGVLM